VGNKDIVSGDYMADNEHFADAFNYFIYDGEKVIKPENLSAAEAVKTAIVNKLDKILMTLRILVSFIPCLVMCLSSLSTRMMRDIFKEH